MPSKSPIYPGPTTARGAVLAVLLSNEDQTGAEPLRGRVTLAAIVRALKRKYNWPIETSSFPSNAVDGRATGRRSTACRRMLSSAPSSGADATG
ncbi:hypothetical protein [Massilia sp. Se16.2.3]|uniref:hypothetical protein n=1 Tax=Massilia sp. Se16.2.3 TaxID=2709303 RepID=UPI001E4B6903|nr:hypothetical protein [Massilia sp. Se16.2.3]